MPISAGIAAPDFSLPDETGTIRRLSNFRGQQLILYFYPEDDTPGCTKEACHFRDDYSAYIEAGVTVLGVSPDSPKSHARFKEKYQLPFSLLADEGHRVCDLYGVWGPKSLFGHDYMGVLRTTFLIDREGNIAHVYEQVRPSEHSAQLLAELAAK